MTTAPDGCEASEPTVVDREAMTLEQIIIHLHEYQHGEKQCVQGNCRRRDIAARLAPAVAALYPKATEDA